MTILHHSRIPIEPPQLELHQHIAHLERLVAEYKQREIEHNELLAAQQSQRRSFISDQPSIKQQA